MTRPEGRGFRALPEVSQVKPQHHSSDAEEFGLGGPSSHSYRYAVPAPFLGPAPILKVEDNTPHSRSLGPLTNSENTAFASELACQVAASRPPSNDFDDEVQWISTRRPTVPARRTKLSSRLTTTHGVTKREDPIQAFGDVDVKDDDEIECLGTPACNDTAMEDSDVVYVGTRRPEVVYMGTRPSEVVYLGMREPESPGARVSPTVKHEFKVEHTDGRITIIILSSDSSSSDSDLECISGPFPAKRNWRKREPSEDGEEIQPTAPAGGSSQAPFRRDFMTAQLGGRSTDNHGVGNRFKSLDEDSEPQIDSEDEVEEVLSLARRGPTAGTRNRDDSTAVSRPQEHNSLYAIMRSRRPNTSASTVSVYNGPSSSDCPSVAELQDALLVRYEYRRMRLTIRATVQWTQLGRGRTCTRCRWTHDCTVPTEGVNPDTGRVYANRTRLQNGKLVQTKTPVSCNSCYESGTRCIWDERDLDEPLYLVTAEDVKRFQARFRLTVSQFRDSLPGLWNA